MCTHPEEYYGNGFMLKLNNLPTAAVDRHSVFLALLSFFLGVLMILLGASYFLVDTSHSLADLQKSLPQGHIPLHSLLSPEAFCALVALIGLGVILMASHRLFYYQKICFDGKNITLQRHTLSGFRQVFTEPLYNYAGVRLRIKFHQYGIMPKNKYIIELHHQDSQKNVPLYISMRPRSLRRRWIEYAQALKMPALKISDKGMVSYNVQDLQQTYRQTISQWHLPKGFISGWNKPPYITLKVRRSGEKMIKIGKIFLDAYNLIAAVIIGMLGSVLVYTALNQNIILQHINIAWLIGLYLIGGLIVIYALLNLATTDIIILARNKIFLFRKILFFKVYRGVIHYNDIKGIDINFVPTLNRYYLAILSNSETLVFGQKMPADDLRWVRALLTTEIIGNE